LTALLSIVPDLRAQGASPVTLFPCASPDVFHMPRDPRRAAVVATALSRIGTPYRWGAESPATGFDCSGFVRWVFDRQGLVLPRTAGEQGLFMRSSGYLGPGDVLVFAMGPTGRHVGIYMGEGWFVHSPHTGACVRIERLDAPAYLARFRGAFCPLAYRDDAGTRGPLR
jgi:cell wall-associated NlpC family hydrolase